MRAMLPLQTMLLPTNEGPSFIRFTFVDPCTLP